ncbi:hypothetical protein OH76DRAFT_542381 [Lentinus brumalis]|uniref:Uncharacterized protein n=1 Tax=Lentinus brumalis TaxID=2498619 RepID=A0A371D9P0_9APHY|nr:hypothetical protein OH76DRAFT_542381 [Polyporus brumalis]
MLLPCTERILYVLHRLERSEESRRRPVKQSNAHEQLGTLLCTPKTGPRRAIGLPFRRQAAGKPRRRQRQTTARENNENRTGPAPSVTSVVHVHCPTCSCRRCGAAPGRGRSPAGQWPGGQREQLARARGRSAGFIRSCSLFFYQEAQIERDKNMAAHGTRERRKDWGQSATHESHRRSGRGPVTAIDPR